MRIMSNIPALQSYNALSSTNNALSTSIARLSTGLRINSAADDAAGLAISEKMRAQIRGLDQATANSQDGISMIQTAEGALSETHSILQRMRELSVQAANDTLTQEDRSYIQLEIDQLKEEVTRIATTTQFNKKKLLDGSAAVLWSSDNLSTKALIRGGLLQVDQFGQKAAVEGNFKISVTAEPGQAEVKKTDIFKIKHENVIMNLQIDKNNGFEKIEVNNLPAGQYSVTQGRVTGTYQNGTYDTHSMGTAVAVGWNSVIGTASMVATLNGATWTIVGTVSAGGIYKSDGSYIASGGTITLTMADHTGYSGQASAAMATFLATDTTFNVYRSSVVVTKDYAYLSGNLKMESFYGLNANDIVLSAIGMAFSENLNMLFEVTNVNKTAGIVTFRVQVNALGADGKIQSYSDSNFQMTTAGVALGESNIGIYFVNASAMRLAAGSINNYDVGDKIVFNFASNNTAAKDTINIGAEINQEWANAWSDGGQAPTMEVQYNVSIADLANDTVQFKNFYLNTANGTTYEGAVIISFNDKVNSLSTAGGMPTKPVVRASFEAAYVGQVAKGDVKLRDLDKFWDANGKFLLEDAQEITIVQGDGTKAKFTLYSTDTLNDVQKKMNNVIAYGLGQAQYAVDAADNFVSFVDSTNRTPNTSESVAGTFVIRSLIPGAAGKLSFSGDEDIIKAFSLNVIQDASENQFYVSVEDAHTGKLLSSNQKITGNVMYGIVNPNVDVEFDSMANIKVVWNDSTKSFDLKKEAGTYETILHLADNTTVFQIGANQGEDMGINIGDMSAYALGISNILVTDRDSASRSITVIDNAINRVSKQRATLGAYQNRLEHTINNLTTASTNTTSAESRIRDADMAKEMMEFTKLNILSQAGTSMLAQSNQLPQNVLSLLR